jgi:hypothetical protein
MTGSALIVTTGAAVLIGVCVFLWLWFHRH